MNNGCYDNEEYKEKQRQVMNKRWGPIENHKFICENCKKEFIWSGRKNTKAFKKVKFCSRSCANSIGGKAKVEKYGVTQYRTIALKYYEEKCIICGFDKVIEIHHIDHDRSNNDISNLVPLCLNHHGMIHKKEYKEETIKLVLENKSF